ncbi:hypothetical protein BJP62_04500 [Jeongeupia sp. USM3]|nr:hypothetical protein BJP62_04500 [Jeongeupia sp. USM3]
MPRERAMLAGGACVAVAALYVGSWQSLSDTSARLARQLPRLESELAELQRGVAEFRRSGAPTATAPKPGELRQHVQAALDAHQINAELQALPGEQLKINLSSVAFGQVLALLGALENDQGLRIVRADIRGDKGTVQAELQVQP